MVQKQNMARSPKTALVPNTSAKVRTWLCYNGFLHGKPRQYYRASHELFTREKGKTRQQCWYRKSPEKWQQTATTIFGCSCHQGVWRSLERNRSAKSVRSKNLILASFIQCSNRQPPFYVLFRDESCMHSIFHPKYPHAFSMRSYDLFTTIIDLAPFDAGDDSRQAPPRKFRQPIP